MKSLPMLAAAVALCATTPAWAALDYYLHIDTIEGESTNADHPKWIDVDSWAWGVSHTGSSGGGGGVGKTVFDDFSWQQGVDKSVVPLFLGVATGKHFKDATLDVVKPGENPKTFFEMVFGEVQLSHLKLNGSGSAMSADGALNYDRVKLRYREQDPKGGLGPWIEGAFDLKAGKLAFSGDPRVIQGLLLAGGAVTLDAGPIGAVPEPATWVLMALGLLAVGGAVGRRKPA